ncbi:serine/threonine-protein kinase [Compostimonas suwonensis]|uniref:non-specific serine/threonine protein kinase n=1 Tax=Compostimonas suwonensis TaxID=1048394 RepID=A0A2M9BUD2_9MICO|nr:serine/threonine-protein kinase [Compostimonas suwonensis]PJJ61567.1 serine/threonine protein kinase [Compostimonas suwonensis]
MARRLPSTPPNLPGFSYLHVLGSGGFADVFLYEQNMPRRQVAVKVMLSELVDSHVRQMFQAEANLMAQLSSHPSILTVFEASVAADGRPYLVMEYCSAGLSQRYRREAIPVSEVLRVGIKIASAVETAHRAGVLHRDIKPSNILVTAYGHPVLSDFGIASTVGQNDSADSVGLSIPWSAPEVLLDETSGTIASEVWSLGATVYSLLAGRSPFEVAGHDNTSAELISRIQKAKPAPTGRSDVPARLEHVLAKAMSKRPDARPASALEFIRELQGVEVELGLPQTPIEVAVDDWVSATEVDPHDRTRITAVSSVSAGPPRRRRRGQTGPQPQIAGQTVAGTIVREGGGEQSEQPAASAGRGVRALAWSLVALAVVVIGLGATALIVLVGDDADESIPTVSAISGTVEGGTVLFSWQDPGLAQGDTYQVRANDEEPSTQRATQFQVNAQGAQRVCLTVTVNRDGKAGPSSSPKCVDVEDEPLP